MTVKPTARCRHCGEQRSPATITMLGPYCKRCYVHFLVPRTCVGCERRTRAEPKAKAPRCRACRNARAMVRKQCALCGRPIRSIEKRLSARRVVGPCCYHKVKPLRQCGYCPAQSRMCTRARTFGITRLACPICLRRRLPQCEECRQRKRIYLAPDGRKLCRRCAKGPRPRYPCVECGHLTTRPTHGRCSYHAARFAVPKIAARLGRSLRRPWVRRLFLRYTDLLLDRVRSSRSIPGYLRRDMGFFAHLDRLFERPTAATNIRLVQALGPRELDRYRRACGFAVSEGLIGSLAEPEVPWALAAWRADQLGKTLASAWARVALERFHTQLLTRQKELAAHGHTRTREPMTPRAVLSALYGATHLLKDAEKRGGSAIQDVTQRDIDRLLSRTKLQPARLSRFISYLNAETARFRPLKMPSLGLRRGLPEGTLDTDDYDLLVDRLLDSADPSDRAGVLASLLCLLYAQPPYRVLQLKRDCVRPDGKGWEIRFRREWVPLQDDLARRLDEWVGVRRELSIVEATDASPYLFPGRKAGCPLTTDALHNWLRPFGIKPQQLQPSSIAQMVQSEAFHPAFAIEALGLSRVCVSKYLEALASPELTRLQALVSAA